MYCEKCGNQLNEGDNFCGKCQNPVRQQNNSSLENANNKAEGWKRVLAVVLDGIITSPLLFFITVLLNVLIAVIAANSDNSSTGSLGIIIAVLIWTNPMFIHSLYMFLFGNTLGNKIMKIQIKNIDGSEANRVLFGREFLLSFLFFIPVLSIASGIICIATKQLSSDHILHLQAYKK